MFQATPTQKLLLKVSFIGTSAEMMLAPIYLGLANRFGGSVEDAGFGFCVFQISTGILVFTFGQSDFFETYKRQMVVIGFALAGGCDLLYLAIHTRAEFYLLQIVAGTAIGIANPAWDSVYEDEDQGEVAQGASKWSFWTGGISFVEGAGAALGGIVARHFGFGPLFVIMAATDAAAVYYAVRMAYGASQ